MVTKAHILLHIYDPWSDMSEGKAGHNGLVEKHLFPSSGYIVNKWMAMSYIVHRTWLLSRQLTIRNAASGFPATVPRGRRSHGGVEEVLDSYSHSDALNDLKDG